MLQIAIANEQDILAINEDRLRRAVEEVIPSERPSGDATIGLAIVDDKTIHELNRRYLDHDWPTDVLSFVLEDSPERLEGEIVVSAETAAARAGEYGWPPSDELLLYVLHGILHLLGYDDKTAEAEARMRDREAHYLVRWGLKQVERNSFRS